MLCPAFVQFWWIIGLGGGRYALYSQPFLFARYSRQSSESCQFGWRRSTLILDQFGADNSNEMKKTRSEETQTLRAGCSKAEPKNFAPPQTPFPGAQDGQNLISWNRSVAYLHPQTQFGEDRCTQFREQRGIGRPKLAQR